MSAANCRTCKHRDSGTVCKAFPKGIPFNILSGDAPHVSAVSGQEGGFVYESKKKQQGFKKTPEVVNQSTFNNVEWDHPEMWRVIGTQGKYSLVSLGKEKGTGDLMVGRTVESDPLEVQSYKAVSLSSLLKFDQGDVTVYERPADL